MQIREGSKYTAFVGWLFGLTMITMSVMTFVVEKGRDVILINGNHTPLQDDFFKLVTHLGEGWIFIPVFVASLFVRYSLSISILTMTVLHGLVCAVAKRVLFADAPRPAAL